MNMEKKTEKINTIGDSLKMARAERFMRIALELAREAASADEVPVGAIVVKGEEIVAQASNRKEREGCATRHAEMLAIEGATKTVGNWWLEDCELFVTLEPCTMCAYAVVLSRLKKVWFGASDEKTGAVGSTKNIFEETNNHKVEYEGGILADECSAVISEFFKNKRKKG